MKKIIVYFAILISASAFSQSIRILQDTTDVTGSTLIRNTEPDREYVNDFRLYNSTDQKKTFAVNRVLKTRLAKDYYVYLGIDVMHLAPSSDSIYSTMNFNISFNIDAKMYLPDSPGKFGLSTVLGTGPVCTDHFISYSVWDINNPSDVSEITIHYSCPTSIHESEAGSFSAAFPNPATSITAIHYTLNTFSKNTSAVLYDVFGKLIKEIPIDQKEGNVLMDVEDLDAGFYFYSFKIGERAVHTGKLIVN